MYFAILIPIRRLLLVVNLSQTVLIKPFSKNLALNLMIQKMIVSMSSPTSTLQRPVTLQARQPTILV